MQKAANNKVKQCSKCGEKKLLSEYYRDKTNKSGYHTWCKVCKNNCHKKWLRNNKNYHKNYDRVKKYGITFKEYNEILENQKFCCGLCGRPRSLFKRDFDVDHNHKTGYIRGLLCNYCNYRIMRHFKDNKNLIKKIIRYLTKALKEDKNWKE